MFTFKFRNLALAGGILLALAILVAVSLPHNASAEEASVQRLISVSGEASLQVKPDLATIRFGVESQAPSALEAQKANSSLMNKVLSALMVQGIAKEEMQTANFSLRPVYEYRGDKPEIRQVLVGFGCSNSVTVTVRDLSKIGSLIDAATEAGANSISGLSFTVKEPQKYREEMLSKAVVDARTKAEIMAKAAGVSITGVYRISDGWTSVEPLGMGEIARDYAGSTPVEPGLVTIRGQVRIDFSF